MNHIFDSYNKEMEAAGQRCPPKDRAVNRLGNKKMWKYCTVMMAVV
jgi:hypothetical protein